MNKKSNEIKMTNRDVIQKIIKRIQWKINQAEYEERKYFFKKRGLENAIKVIKWHCNFDDKLTEK